MHTVSLFQSVVKYNSKKKMQQCLCNHLYSSKPVETKVFAFSGSLCRIHKFETIDGSRFCLTIFSLSDYKHLHFPHAEYKWFICRLYVLQSTWAILHSDRNTDFSALHISQAPSHEGFKIKFGNKRMDIGSVTSFGLVKTSPFNVFSCSEKQTLNCASKWDICTCQNCPVFNRMIDFEAEALKIFNFRQPENVIFTT